MTKTMKTMTYAQARKILARRGEEIVGYSGQPVDPAGWHRFTLLRGRTLDIRYCPRTGKVETR